MATPAEIVTAIETAIAANPLAASVTVDGTTVTVANAEARLEYWRGRAAQAAGNRPRISRIKLGSFPG